MYLGAEGAQGEGRLEEFRRRNQEWERCRSRWQSYEEAAGTHLRDIELLIQWDGFQDKTPEERLEEALCLHMHLANQREHLDRLTCDARDLVVVALAHYHANQKMENDETMNRDKYIGEIKEIWKKPNGKTAAAVEKTLAR